LLKPDNMSRLTEHDIYLFKEGSHVRLYESLGCQLAEDGSASFAVWAPNARSVAVIGDFNGWDPEHTPMSPRQDGSGIWEARGENVSRGTAYKFRVVPNSGRTQDKGDPFALYWEEAPRTASRTWTLEYDWNDGEWMRTRGPRNALTAPMSIYELHLGSWRRGPDNTFLGYRGIAEPLVEHMKRTSSSCL
jgi:1,4-alpha-glucan branching enzyme